MTVYFYAALGKTRELFVEEVGMCLAGFSKASEKEQSLTFAPSQIFLILELL